MAPIIPVLCANLDAQPIPIDYQAWFDAERAFAAGRQSDVLELTQRVHLTTPRSPLSGKAAVLAGRAHLALGRASEALAHLKKYDDLPQPEGTTVLAEAAEGAGQRAAAAGYWQFVFYKYPLSKEAGLAETSLLRLRGLLGAEFPPAMPKAVFERAETLRRSGQAARAKRELLEVVSSFGGLDRQLAQVRAHHGEYAALATLKVTHAEAEAERLYLMHAAARRNSLVAEAEAALKELDRRFPDSDWTREALTSWGNHFLLRNDADQYVPLYRKCAERFHDDYCSWKVAWRRWMTRERDAARVLSDYVERFPNGDKASVALYFLKRDEELLRRFPMSWYAVLARERARAAGTNLSPPAERWTASPEMTARIARAKQLTAAGFHDWAEFEMRYGAASQPFVAAMELADIAASRGAHDQALRYIKSVARGYLSMSLEEAPERFWKLAFPLPYRRELEQNSRQQGLDPFLVAALIRQESEFNPRALSRAKAYGLTQVLPSTGRQLSRRVGIQNFQPGMLFNPDVNLRLGTYYLRMMMDGHSGRQELTLASYNAGKSRTDMWLTWYDYREAAEFVESIPFTETRNYVQIVLRNADVYRRLWGTTVASNSYKRAGE